MNEATSTPDDILAAVPPPPIEPTVPPEVIQTQPRCPLCKSLIYPVTANEVGDLLFECLNDGYEAIYRVASQDYEKRPGRDTERRWAPPTFEA
jgi:hypothetical protein